MILAGAAGIARAHEEPVETQQAQPLGDFDYEPPAPGSYDLPVIRQAPDGQVVDVEGRPQSLAGLSADRIVVLSLIYTACETECPLGTSALYDLYYASAEDPGLAQRVKLISLSFDPERDSPEAMASYGYAALAESEGKSPWDFLTTASRRELGPIVQGFGQVVDRPPIGASHGVINHLLRVYLIDRRGAVRNIYGLEFLDPRLLLTDIRTLLMEEQTAKGL
jgi:cytochrome oxidase Cu insertion factor (SCO1/SenC/PrrC family)